jgi:hypothetical protein
MKLGVIISTVAFSLVVINYANSILKPSLADVEIRKRSTCVNIVEFACGKRSREFSQNIDPNNTPSPNILLSEEKYLQSILFPQ